MKYIISDSNPLFIITNTIECQNLKNIIKNNPEINLIHLNDIFTTSNQNASEIMRLGQSFDANENACVLYTSGSTGQPKGVVLSNFTIMNRLNWQWDEFCLDDFDMGAFKTSLDFVCIFITLFFVI